MQLPFSLQLIIKQQLRQYFPSLSHIDYASVGGGSINQTYRLDFLNQHVFCKINSASKFPQLFQKEQRGLALIQKQKVIKVPGVIDCFETDGYQVLLMDFIQQGERTEQFWKNFGEQLAALHAISGDHFGLDEDNYMGSVKQDNQYCNDWISFFINQRLHPLAVKCFDKKLLSPAQQKSFERLYKFLPDIFEKDQKPSLVHGDLWSGNFMCNEKAEPILIDPAVYYGHPSVDLAMTTLFGGFRSAFYDAYHYHAALPENYETQWQVCNLYPLLIHLYLFGKNYLPQIEQTLHKF